MANLNNGSAESGLGGKDMNRKVIIRIVSVVLVLGLALGVSAALLGDVNGDGKVSVFDAQMLVEEQLGLRQLTSQQLANKGDAGIDDVIDQVLDRTPGVAENTIALVKNGAITTQVESVADMVAAVSADGNTVITLYKDLSTDGPIILPYSCTFDLNGHTVCTNPTSGYGIQVQAVGTQNKIATIKNGTLVHYDVGIRVAAGAVAVENMTVRALAGPCITVYDNSAAYKSLNRISGSTLISENYVCFSFHMSNRDFKKSGVSVDNSVLISSKNKNGATGTVFGCASGATMGVVNIGENVEVYSYGSSFNPTVAIPYEGNLLGFDSQKVSVTVGDITYKDLNHWSTNIAYSGKKILLVGNSFSLRLGEELHKMAQARGEELFVANLYYGGCTVEQHWTWLQDNTPNYEYYVHNAMGRWTDYDVTTLGAALAQEDWEIITLQQHFSPDRTGTYEAALNSCTPYVKNLFDYFKQNNPDADLYWYQTWAYSTAHSSIGTTAVQTNQYNQIKAVSAYLAQQNGVPQIPCGDAWQIARANPLVTEDPCLTDNFHAGTTTGGRYLNACVFYETLLGKSCIGNVSDGLTYKLDADLAAQLQLAAHQAVADMYGEDYAK